MLLPYSFRKFLSLCRRVPNRRGYGIHSPFAFGFVTGVIYERGEFYAYDELRKMRRDGSHALREKDERLLLRIANFQHPQSGTLLGDPAPTTRWALAAGCRKCAWRDDAEASRADMLYAASGSWALRLGKLVEEMPPKALIVVHKPYADADSAEAWRTACASPRVTLSFDLFDFGLLFIEERFAKSHYPIFYV